MVIIAAARPDTDPKARDQYRDFKIYNADVDENVTLKYNFAIS